MKDICKFCKTKVEKGKVKLEKGKVAHKSCVTDENVRRKSLGLDELKIDS